MRQRQVLVCESDGLLAAMLRPLVQAQGWRLSEVRHPRVCLGLLPQGPGSVLVLRVGRDVTRELTLLEQTAWLFPETAVIVVCDADNPALVELAWDLQARFVLQPASARELLPSVVEGFLTGGAGVPS
jgi:DNA-binding NarL/FixJ family response regulator